MRLLYFILSIFIILSTQSSGQTLHEVSISGFSFVPENLTIDKGDTVRWVNPTGTFHTTTSGDQCTMDGIWNSDLNPGDSFIYVFDNSGDFPYFCIPHCGSGMTGSITVECNSVNAMVTVDMHESCQGECDGQATASGGTNYMWSDGQTTATATDLCAGSYNVTVSDGSGCSDVASVTIDPGTTITATVMVDMHESCQGACDGQATASGGTNYMWSDGQTTAIATNLCAGTYVVTVSDANGCSDITTVTINSGSTVNATADVIQDESCLGLCDGEAFASGGTNYMWSDGQTTATATNLCPGGYDVTVSDVNGCSDVASVTIDPGTTVAATATVDMHESCQGRCDGQATASGGVNYIWSNGQTTATATDLCPGTFNVTVSDNNNCSDITSITINPGSTPSTPVFSFNMDLCLNDPPQSLPTTSDNGIIGNWSGEGVANNEFNPGDAGIGDNVITFNPNQDQCAMSTDVTMVVENCNCQNPPSADAGSNQLICGSNSPQLNGTIMNTPSATWSTTGTGVFNDNSSLDAIYTPSQADIDSGEVTLTLTTVDPDGSGPCMAVSDQLVLTFGFQPDIDNYIDVSKCNEYVLPPFMGDVSPNVAYYDQVDGMGTQYAPGDIITESKEIYVYDVQDGCSDQDSFEITINSISVDAGMDLEITSGTSTTLSGSVSGGSGNYAYEWTPQSQVINPMQQETETENLSMTTTFTFMVTDNLTGCQGSDQVIVTIIGGALTVNISTLDMEICKGDTTGITASASGGSGGYNYSWTSIPAGFTSNKSVIDVSPEMETIYVVEVMDDEGATIRDSISIIVNDLPVANAGADQLYCASDSIIQVCAEEVNNAMYSWSNGSSSINGRCVDLTEGIWSLEVENSDGCVNSDTIQIQQLDPLEVELFADSSVSITGGIMPYDTVFVRNEDTLKVIVTDSIGCMQMDIEVLTSSSNSLLSNITVYPNPANDKLYIKNINVQHFQLSLYNQNGIKVLSKQDTKQLSLKWIPGGFYYLEIHVLNPPHPMFKRFPIIVMD